MNAPTLPDTTVLELSGRDALMIVQRISSQHLEDLAAGAARTTLFCDFRGRLLHRATVARTDDGTVWLLRSDAPGADLLAHVDRHVFREDVQLEDRSAAWSVRAALRQTEDPEVETRDGVPVSVSEGHGFRLTLAPAEATTTLSDALERERIMHGRPRHGHEVHEDFNPYEIGCADEVHLSKGCYTGQEALQRLITYDSVRRVPVRVRGRGVPPPVPCDLIAAAGKVGRLTSAVAAETDGEWIGIAIVRKEAIAALDSGAHATFAPEGAGDLIACEPFVARWPLGRAMQS